MDPTFMYRIQREVSTFLRDQSERTPEEVQRDEDAAQAYYASRQASCSDCTCTHFNDDEREELKATMREQFAKTKK